MSTAIAFKPIVVAPTFNNARSLTTVLRGIARCGLPVIVVNDGSTDDTAEILRQWKQDSPGDLVLTHEQNQGKAQALQTGFGRARLMGYTHVVTIDTDAQLDPVQIPELLAAAQEAPTALIVGARDAGNPDCPTLSRLGRWASNQLVHFESGARVTDSQCGFRVYPLRAIAKLRCFAGRFGFETEIITRCAWAGIHVHQPPVRCLYNIPEGRVSHFRPWRDSLSACAMHLRLLTASLWPWPAPPHGATTGKPAWRGMRWLSPRKAWRSLRCNPQERPRFAAALATGVFIGNLPIYGVQTLLCLYSARRFRLNPVPVLIGSYISTPPIGPILIGAAIALGHWVTHGTFPQLQSFNPHSIGYLALLRSVLVDWTIGGIVCGMVLGSITFVLMRLLLQRMPIGRPAGSTDHRGASVAIPAGAVAESAV